MVEPLLKHAIYDPYFSFASPDLLRILPSESQVVQLLGDLRALNLKVGFVHLGACLTALNEVLILLELVHRERRIAVVFYT